LKKYPTKDKAWIYEFLEGLERRTVTVTTSKYGARVMTQASAKELKDVSDLEVESVGMFLPLYLIL
jgi:hypothetical protein